MLRVNQLTGFNRRRTGATSAPCRYLRLVVSDVHAGTIAGFFDVSFSDDGGVTDYPTSNMTSNTTPSPNVTSASSEYSATFAAWKAFNGATGSTDRWASGIGQHQNAWIQVDLGAGNEISANHVSYTIYNDTANDMSPTEIFVYESETGAFTGEEVELFTVSGLTSQSNTTVVTHSF